MSFKNETEKIVLLRVKGLIQILSSSGLKKFVQFLSSTSHPILRGAQNIAIGARSVE